MILGRWVGGSVSCWVIAWWPVDLWYLSCERKGWLQDFLLRYDFAGTTHIDIGRLHKDLKDMTEEWNDHRITKSN